MDIRNQDKGHNWQARVREYDDISDTVYSEEESWKIIRERLDGPPERKTYSFYWLAAASVIFFFLTVLLLPVGKKINITGFTKTPAVFKQNKNAHRAVDTIQAAVNNAVKAITKPKITTTALPPAESLQIVHTKKESVVPSPGDSLVSASSDTAAVANDMANQRGPLPKIHINDLNDEPLPENVTLKNLSVKKMIRLFSTDFTKEKPSIKQGAMPPNQNTIPNNQN